MIEGLVYLLIAVAATWAWSWWAVALARAPRSRDRGREARRTILLATGPALAAAAVALTAYFNLRDVRHLADATVALTVVPAPAALAMTAAGVAVVVVVALRHRRPFAPFAGADELLPSDRMFWPWVLGALLTLGSASLTLGLWGHGVGAVVGAVIGVAVVPAVVVLQRLGLLLLEKVDGEPPAPRRLLAWTLVPLALLGLAPVTWMALRTRPRALLEERLGPLPASVTDVRVEERRLDILVDEWHLSFRVDPAALARRAEARGYERRGEARWVRLSARWLHGGTDLWLDAEGRAHLRGK